MDDETADYWFGDHIRDDLDDAIEASRPYVYPTRLELEEQIHHANQSAIRLRGTIYYDRAHKFIDELLDIIEGR